MAALKKVAIKSYPKSIKIYLHLFFNKISFSIPSIFPSSHFPDPPKTNLFNNPFIHNFHIIKFQMFILRQFTLLN